MRAVGYTKALPVSDERCLVDIELEQPAPSGFDLPVEVHAVPINPIDVKCCARDDPRGIVRVLGYDGSGIVVAAGERISRFRFGDAVYYAGSLFRPGTNCQFHSVDERLVGRKPARLSFAEAAALPLTALTAYD
jgi:NADPH:quinone reductase-like Zn-dependent oxidoreductase